MSSAAAELFNKSTKQRIACQSVPITPPQYSGYPAPCKSPPTPTQPSKWLSHHNKAVHRKSLQCTAVGILTLYNDFPQSELKWLLTNSMPFFEQTWFQVFRFVQQLLFKWWLTLAFCILYKSLFQPYTLAPSQYDITNYTGSKSSANCFGFKLVIVSSILEEQKASTFRMT